MKKQVIAVVLVLAMVLCLTACSDAGEKVNSVASGVAGSVKSFIKGDVTGTLNKSYSTQWFDFTVHSIKTAYSYSGYDVDDGWKFVIVNVTETNTFGEPIPMSVYDFELGTEIPEEEDRWPLEPLDDSPQMMPEEFELADGESATYDVVFVIPDEIVDISFIYVELDDTDATHATFTIKHSL